MTTDQMRAEFEKWAKAEFFDPLYPYINNAERDEKGYYHTVTDNCWVAWQAAYAAGRKAERQAIQNEALQQLVDEAQKLDMGY